MPATLSQAIAAIKAGDKTIGQHLLAEVLKAEPNNEAAWLWLASLAETLEQRRPYLERVLAINPGNELAQQGLATLNSAGSSQPKSEHPKQVQARGEPSTPPSSAEPKSITLHPPLRRLASRSTQVIPIQAIPPPPISKPSAQTVSSAAALQQIAAARTRGLTPDLSGLNLGGADLAGADLSESSLHDIDLSGANLSQANLRHSNLTQANLSGANLSGAKLNEAKMDKANLSRADLSSANANGAHFSEANLAEANLSGAHLGWADFRQANLAGANLSGAKLDKANLRDTNLSGIVYSPETRWPAGFTPPKLTRPVKRLSRF
jgi:hypothetical protein